MSRRTAVAAPPPTPAKCPAGIRGLDEVANAGFPRAPIEAKITNAPIGRPPPQTYLWQYSPEATAIHAALDEVIAAAKAAAASSSVAVPGPSMPTRHPETGTQLQNYPSGATARRRPPVLAGWPAAERRRRAPVGIVGAITLAVVLVITAILARGSIMAMWPSAGPALVTLHLADPPGQGLEISSMLRRTADSLIIQGVIVNKTAMSRRVPRVRLTMRDGDRSDLAAKIIDPPVERLMPGDTAHFNAVFEHPSITATGVAVEFAAD
jgi:Protein of unknown function (DUF3426)